MLHERSVREKHKQTRLMATSRVRKVGLSTPARGCRLPLGAPDDPRAALYGDKVVSIRPENLPASPVIAAFFLQNPAFSKWAMLDLNQRPPPCKFGQSFSDRFYPVGKSSLFKQYLPCLAALFSCSVRVRPAPVAAWLQHLTLLRPVEVGLRRRRRICSCASSWNTTRPKATNHTRMYT